MDNCKDSSARPQKPSTDVDIAFTVESTQFDAHTDIMSRESPVLQHMIETATDPNNIVVNGVTTDEFQKILTYLYFHEIKIAGTKEAIRMHHLAEKFAIVGLEEKCVYHLSHVGPEKSCEVYELVSGIPQFHSVVAACERLFSSSTKEVILSNSFMDSSTCTVEAILKRNSLAVPSEAYLFDAVIRWVKKNTSGEGSIRDAIFKFLPYIRFDFMTSKRVVEAAEEDILTYEELMYILIRKAKPQVELTQMPSTPSFFKSRDISRDLHYSQVRLNEAFRRINTAKKQVREARKQLSFAVEVTHKCIFIRKFSFLYICRRTEITAPVTVFLTITNRCTHLKFIATMYVTRVSGHFDVYFPRDVFLSAGETMIVELDLCDTSEDFQGLSINSVVCSMKKTAFFEIKGVGSSKTMLCLRDVEVNYPK